jgi:hypothetical protein
MKTQMSAKTRDLLIDSVLFSTLFYLVAHPSTYGMTKSVLPMMKDRVLVHAMVYALVFFMIQYSVKRY